MVDPLTVRLGSMASLERYLSYCLLCADLQIERMTIAMVEVVLTQFEVTFDYSVNV